MGNRVSDQAIREQWENDGALDARERGRKIAKQILAKEEKSYISPEQDQTIREKFNILLA
jgi:trimethylamine:corrinoid methyltransferase-like protein